MGEKEIRAGIERRFVLSILWVGVIPMTLALLIGYFAAREGQQIAVTQNLLTAARKTVDGVRLVVRERERTVARVARSPELIQFLREVASDGDTLSEAAVHTRLEQESSASPELGSVFYLFDKEGAPVYSSDGSSPPRINGLTSITEPRYVDIKYAPDPRHYSALLVAPVLESDGTAIWGHLVENQRIDDLIELVLGHRPVSSRQQEERYEIVVFADDARFTLIIEEGEEDGDDSPPPPTVSEVQSRLAERLLRRPEREEDSFVLWSYESRGRSAPVLMAYRKLDPDMPVYIVVHIPTPDAFFTINLAAGATLVASMIIIGIFCAVAYRIVNNTVIRPLSLLNEGAQIIRQGDLELKLKIETGDEIEELASSFNQMAAALRVNMKRLTSSEEKYRHLVTSMRDGIFQTTSSNVVTFINPAGVAILGYERIDEVLGRNLAEFFLHEDDYVRITGEIAQMPYIDSVRVWLCRPDNEPICVELSGNRLVDDSGARTGIEGSFRDVTRNVRLEREVADRAERIATVNQIANVVNSSVEAGRVYENLIREVHRLVEFDYASTSLRLDDGSFETRQLWPEPQQGRELFPRMDGENSCAAWVARERRCLLLPDIGAVCEDSVVPQFPESVRSCLCVPLFAETSIIGCLTFGAFRKEAFTDHEAKMFEQMAPHLAAAIRNAQLLENLKRTLEDVTKAREKLHAANEELKSLDEMKTHLLSNVSHELRTPLVAVMGYTDMILNGKAGPISEPQREYLGITLRNVEKLVTLIENLLDFSRLHRGAEEMVFTRFDLLECIQASMQTVKPVADGRGIILALTLHDQSGAILTPPVTIEGDKGKLGQVFNNLLANAVKFNKNEGRVTVDVEKRKDMVHIAVSDTGIGIPEEALDKVFTRFYQYDASSTRKYGGTGIGLSIAQDIVRLHGSRITASSAPGEGATFRFALPLYISHEERAESKTDRPLPIETHLLVELVSQDRALSTQIRQLLLSEGMDVIHAAYPAAAMSLAQKYNPDCIIVDAESGPTGHVLLDDMVHEPLPVNVPVILLSDDESLYQRFQRSVATRVRRNFRKSTLLSGIHHALSEGAPADNPLGARILCVDDDEEVLQFLAICLENEGYGVDCCGTGEEALQRAEQGEHWLVLLDIAMPGIDGYETCRKLKANGRLTGIKVYFVTAKPVDSHSNEMRDCGADGYMVKPFKAEDIVAVVRAFDAQRGQLHFL